MKKLVWIFGVCVALILTGCAVSREAVKSAYEKAQVCCNSLAQLKYEMLPPENLKSFDIDEHSDMFAFDTGRSFVLAVELPPLKPPFVVRIKSFVLGDFIDNSQVFYPVVLVLDSHHQVLSRQQPPPNISLGQASFSETLNENKGGLAGKFQWDLPVYNQEARYLVIYTDAKILASGEARREVPRFIPVILPGIVTALPTNQTVTLKVPYSAFGRISLQALPYSPSKQALSQPECTSIDQIENVNEGGLKKVAHIKGGDAVLFIALNPAFSAPEFDYGDKYRDVYFIESIKRTRKDLYEGGVDEVMVWKLPLANANMGVAIPFRKGCAVRSEPDQLEKLMLMYKAYLAIQKNGLDSPTVRDSIKRLLMADYSHIYKDEMIDIIINNLRPLMADTKSSNDNH